MLGNSQVVRIFRDFQEVTAHPRAKQSWQVMRQSEHAPPRLEQYLNLTHEGLVQWASRLGPSVALVAQEIFADQAVDGMRLVRPLIRLADKYTTPRLEAACRRALHFATPSYRSVKNILVHELDRLPPQHPAQPEDGQIQFRFACEHGYFDTDHAAQAPRETGDTSMDKLALLNQSSPCVKMLCPTALASYPLSGASVTSKMISVGLIRSSSACLARSPSYPVGRPLGDRRCELARREAWPVGNRAGAPAATRTRPGSHRAQECRNASATSCFLACARSRREPGLYCLIPESVLSTYLVCGSGSS